MNYFKTKNYMSQSYIGETCHHFKSRLEEHIKKDNTLFLCKIISHQQKMLMQKLYN